MNIINVNILLARIRIILARYYNNVNTQDLLITIILL